ncbi:MAG: TonB-dependent receptor [Caulobacter sp.]|nr:TonB-dependent receptor [Caulobacter sp.]
MTNHNRSRAGLFGAASLVLLVGAGAPGLALAADDAARPTEVETVTVTAQKREENIQDVPISVTAVGGEKLSVLMSGGGDIRFLSSRVPSLTLESSFGRTFPRFYIRGLGNTDFDLNASQPVSLIYDDVVLENPVVKGYPAFDLDHIEVLRGPQGTLFGRNTPAGIVKLDSAKPSFTPKAYASVSWATFNTVNAEAAIGGPLIADKMAGRFSVLVQHRDNWVDNGFTHVSNATEGYKEYALRGQLLFTPTENFSALLNLHGMHLNGTPRLFRANIIQSGSNSFVPGFDRDTIFQDAQPRAFQHVDTFGGSAKLEYDFGDIKLTSVTGYEHAKTLSRGDIDGGFGAVFAPPSGPGFIPFPSESADGLPHHSQWTQELRLASDTPDPLTWQVGAFYFKEDVTIDSFDYNTLAGGTLDGFAEQKQKTEAWALFGTMGYTFENHLKVSAGVRYSDEKKDFIVHRTLSPFGAPNLTKTANPSSNNVSWDVNVTYPVTEQVNLYARIAKGFRAPSIQGRVVFSDTVSVAKTETILSYEAGVKSYMFNRRLRLDADVFYYDLKDQQLTAVGGGSNANILVNADKTVGYGFEVDADWVPVDHLYLTAGLSYNHTEIQDPNLSIAPCGSGCTVLDPAYAPVPGTVSIDGNSLPNAPEWIANVTAKWVIPYGNGEFFIYTDWAYRSKINFFLYESREYSDDRLLEGGLRLGYSYDGGRWEAAVFGRNITNDKSLEGGIDFDNLTGFVNDPATYGVEFKVKL